MASPAPPRRVCVTGGGGYIASWLVKLLLARGYAVHATVRDPCDPKNAHLEKLDEAPENLRLFRADLLDYDALTAAIAGCEGVFHVATPVPGDEVADPESEVMIPAVKGTSNVLHACSAMNVQKVVVVSSTAAVHFNPNWPQDIPKDENCWSDKELCKEKKYWYCVAKIVSEEMALEYSEKNGLNLVTVCPCLVLGPLLQPVVNTSSKFLICMMKGGPEKIRNRLCNIVDVRDVADALLLVYEAAGSSGRYLCAPHHITTWDLVHHLKRMRPGHNYVNVNSVADDDPAGDPLTSQKLVSVGWRPRELEETLSDSVEFYEKAGLLKDDGGQPCRLPHLFQLSAEKSEH